MFTCVETPYVERSELTVRGDVWCNYLLNALILWSFVQVKIVHGRIVLNLVFDKVGCVGVIWGVREGCREAEDAHKTLVLIQG